MKKIQPNLTKSRPYPVDKPQNKTQRRWLFLLKLLLSGIAIAYVLKKISPSDIAHTLGSARTLYLAFAFLLFMASKTAAAFRTFLILKRYGVDISLWENIKLYWAGMFYNLFLPGGIGGDVYKTLVINEMHGHGMKTSGGAILMDRISGVTALIILALLFVPFTGLHKVYGWVSVAGIPLSLAGFYVALTIFTPRLKKMTGKLLTWSFLVQMLQIFSVFFILTAFHVGHQPFEYLFLFLVSSVAAMLPISIGGIGIREMVFLWGSHVLSLNQEIAVTISLTFYVISAAGSSLGVAAILQNKYHASKTK